MPDYTRKFVSLFSIQFETKFKVDRTSKLKIPLAIWTTKVKKYSAGSLASTFMQINESIFYTKHPLTSLKSYHTKQ